MVTSALACDGAVLIAWQHEDIALTAKTGSPGISGEILTPTGTTMSRRVGRPVRLARATISCSYSIGRPAVGR